MPSLKANKTGGAAQPELQVDHRIDGNDLSSTDQLKLSRSTRPAPGRGPYSTGWVADGRLMARGLYREARFRSCIVELPGLIPALGDRTKPGVRSDMLVPVPESLTRRIDEAVDASWYASKHSGEEVYFLPDIQAEPTR